MNGECSSCDYSGLCQFDLDVTSCRDVAGWKCSWVPDACTVVVESPKSAQSLWLFCCSNYMWLLSCVCVCVCLCVCVCDIMDTYIHESCHDFLCVVECKWLLLLRCCDIHTLPWMSRFCYVTLSGVVMWLYMLYNRTFWPVTCMCMWSRDIHMSLLWHNNEA